jgi:hypothetical protein
MRCEDFRTAVSRGEDEQPMRDHVRLCNSCLEHAVAIDPDYLFRSIGGEELVPPGGIDQFVGGVMQQVSLLERRRNVVPHRRAAVGYAWALAASLGLAVLSFTLVTRQQSLPPMAPVAALRPAPAAPTTVLPVVEKYENSSATIVEVPAQETGGVQVVMIFDDTLPTDL